MSESAADIFGRMLHTIGTAKDKELAMYLGVSPQAVSNARKKGKVPSDLILHFAEKSGATVEWLLTGKGSLVTGEKENYLQVPQIQERHEAYSDPVAGRFLQDWLQLSDVVKMRIWTLVKEELEKQRDPQ